MGLLRVRAQLRVSQFWPAGESDADTLKVEVDESSFAFREDAAKTFTRTTVFHDAVVAGRVRKKPIERGKMAVRLQGIDAPELHYRPSTLERDLAPTPEQRAAYRSASKNYRQHFAETAAAALGELFRPAAEPTLACTITTRVQHPTDVFDTYGRFVGDVFVKVGRGQFHINRWLLEQGWALPAFYVSMQEDEILNLAEAALRGRVLAQRAWTRLSARNGRFDRKLVQRRDVAAFDPRDDGGSYILPKLFRRQCTWWARKQAGIFRRSFLDYLRDKQRSDSFYLTSEFFDLGIFSARPQFLNEHFASGGVFLLDPVEIVFKEEAAKLVGADNQEVFAW